MFFDAHQSLYTAIVIGNAFHIGGVLPVGNSLLIQSAAAQDKPYVHTHKTKVLYHQSMFLIKFLPLEICNTISECWQ